MAKQVPTGVASNTQFIEVAKFIKRFDIHYDSSARLYSARDKKTGDEYTSSNGEALTVVRAKDSPRIEVLLTIEHKFKNATEFAYAIYAVTSRASRNVILSKRRRT